MNPRDGSPLQPEHGTLDSDYFQPPDSEQDETIQHSLFGEILDWMLAPLLLLWPMSIVITYLVAKAIANQPFDHALEENVTVLAQQVKEVNGQTVKPLPGSSRDFLRGDDSDNVYFLILGRRGEYIDGDRDLPPPLDEDRFRSGTVLFRNDTIHGTPIRVAFSYLDLPPGAPDEPRRALVQVAETLEKRAQLANAIIKGVILPQFIILPIVLALVWFALARGLSPLAQLQERIRARPPDDLSPIEPGQVPEEITPLVGSLNDMLARLSLSIDMQKRFIADAAHQMKTPLAGMRMQSELALRQTDQQEIHRSLLQLAKSSEVATRLVNQLLALARAENQPQAGTAFIALELNELARGLVQDWVTVSFTNRIDLGFEQAPYPITISGNPMMLRELLSNLIDNALRYTPAGGSVTVRVRGEPDSAILEVEDTGPGIAPSERLQVFERFYRILGSNAEGSGLGLAIVREIAQQHGAEIDIYHNPRAATPKWPGTLLRLSFPQQIPENPDEREANHGRGQ
ncbi:sensor histidine kinase N-terminal domain-containing protein [Janthinobacterium agaricidamnosum]|uniref:histidine kinase n=1 Tax=Janthinobacterium agaricidamnosum NBRC 102515 = DSM 9628 TaxID=1349767 RepID=W0UX95_9BURK|nr:sensor histidine kinase N-terminal domain-containing protein [Janthinobacterium agaricidamnosum]CDG81169.1 HAMP domain protein [Janthinobacterium agaricidamnosum NBRC 102515 = DSM 9628]